MENGFTRCSSPEEASSSSTGNRYHTPFPQNAPITNNSNFHDFYPDFFDFEYAFSTLSLSPNPYRSQVIDRPRPELIPLPAAHNSVWAQAQSSSASYDNGLFGFTGAHQRINVGPDVFSGVGPFLGGAAPDHYRRRELLDTTVRENYGCGILHENNPCPRYNNQHRNFVGDFPLPLHQHRNFVGDFPLPREQHQHQHRNFGNSGSSSYGWQQEIGSNFGNSGSSSYGWQQEIGSNLNSKLEEGLSAEQIEFLLPKVSVEVMRDQFGSQFVPNLFAAANENQRTRIIRSLTRNPSDFVSLCVNSYGARAVQKLLEKMVTAQQMSLVVTALTAGGTLTVCTDTSGQHVIKHCVKNFFPEYAEKLLNEIANNYYQIATNKSGCCVLQSCVEHPHGEATQRLISKIVANAIHLSEDPYGNYVVQHLIGLRMPRVTADLVTQFQGHFVSLSCNKFASHVVERFLKDSGEYNTSRIVRELVEDPNGSMLLIDPFGNFVIQSALSAAKGGLLNALLKMIEVNEQSMQSNLYGKKILACCDKRKCIGCGV